MTIGERVKQLRCNLGMTQEELAKSIGYNSRSAINKIESGERRLNQITISKLAVALHTTPSYLMGWEDEELENNKNLSPNHNRQEVLLEKINTLDEDIFNEVYDFVEYMLKKQAERSNKQD